MCLPPQRALDLDESITIGTFDAYAASLAEQAVGFTNASGTVMLKVLAAFHAISGCHEQPCA